MVTKALVKSTSDARARPTPTGLTALGCRIGRCLEGAVQLGAARRAGEDPTAGPVSDRTGHGIAPTARADGRNKTVWPACAARRYLCDRGCHGGHLVQPRFASVDVPR